MCVCLFVYLFWSFFSLLLSFRSLFVSSHTIASFFASIPSLSLSLLTWFTHLTWTIIVVFEWFALAVHSDSMVTSVKVYFTLSKLKWLYFTFTIIILIIVIIACFVHCYCSCFPLPLLLYLLVSSRLFILVLLLHLHGKTVTHTAVRLFLESSQINAKMHLATTI